MSYGSMTHGFVWMQTGVAVHMQNAELADGSLDGTYKSLVTFCKGFQSGSADTVYMQERINMVNLFFSPILTVGPLKFFII